ncbi:GtrA-like protein [Geobacillus sp. BCO2]|nr:GtrA-like protein [Geobacillus sp. BCO2]
MPKPLPTAPGWRTATFGIGVGRFQVKRKANIKEVLRFLVVNGLSFGASLAVLLAAERFASLWLAKLAATIAGMAVNFIGSRYWVFVEMEK